MKVVSNLKRPTPKGLNNNDPGCNPGKKVWREENTIASPEVGKTESPEENTNTEYKLEIESLFELQNAQPRRGWIIVSPGATRGRGSSAGRKFRKSEEYISSFNEYNRRDAKTQGIPLRLRVSAVIIFKNLKTYSPTLLTYSHSPLLCICISFLTFGLPDFRTCILYLYFLPDYN